MLSCCGKVFPYSFLFCRIYNVKEEEERGIRRRKKIEEDRRREITIAPQKFNFWGAVYQQIFSVIYLLSNIYLERNHRQSLF